MKEIFESVANILAFGVLITTAIGVVISFYYNTKQLEANNKASNIGVSISLLQEWRDESFTLQRRRARDQWHDLKRMTQDYTACLLGTFKRGCALGRRFTARGSLRPGRFPTRCPATAFKRTRYNSGNFFLAIKVIFSLNASRVCTVHLKLISLGKIPNKVTPQNIHLESLLD